MLLLTKSKAIAAITAAALAFSAMPAMAWGKKEQGFVAGAATAIIVDQLLQGHRARQAPQPRYVERNYVEPRYVERQYVEPRRHQRNYYVEPERQSISVHQTPAAQAFRSYSMTERKAIQRELRRSGYYSGGIDGAFGTGTYSAISSYARDSGNRGNLNTTGGAFAVYDGLLF